MRTFSELLREYIARTGVSDAELARSVGVQRQTIFRWKEGLVARPRSAEEVLRLASKLRLTPAERDELLLAAGFPPVSEPTIETAATRGETVSPAPDPAEPEATEAVETALDAAGARARFERAPAPVEARRLRIAVAVGAGLMLLLALAAAFVSMRPRAQYPQAGPGETLILVAPFRNYTGGEQGYNVAGRLQEALERELSAAGLEDARAAAWPTEVTDEPAAGQALARSGATLLIWGEYDSGRVVARFQRRSDGPPSGRELSLLAATPGDLPAVINSGLPGDIRYLALHSLAQAYLEAGRTGQALAALGQAGLNLPQDAGTQAAHHFLVGYANQTATSPDIDAAIDAYGEALRLDEQMTAARNNRAVAYLRRRGPGDMTAAIEDLTRYLAQHGEDADAYNNRGSAYLYLGGAENARRALADFDKAVALAPEHPTGYYNRGLAHVRLDEGARWQADFQRALDSGHSRAREGLCWGYSLSEEPARAVEYCRQAIDAGGDPGMWENLAVTHARTGQYEEAATALRKFRETELGAAKEALVADWLDALSKGLDPFDPETLRRLREE